MKRLEDLDAYLTGELADGPALDAFEEAMFDAPDDPDLALVDTLARRGALLLEHGTWDVSLTRAQIDAMRAQGTTFGFVECGAPGVSAPVFPKEGEIVCSRLHTGQPDLGLVDIEIHLVAYNVTKVIRDVLVDPLDGVIHAVCERPLAELAFGGGRTHVRVRRRDATHDVVAEWDVTATM